MSGGPADGYGLDPLFERAVLCLCACAPGFWSRVGYALDPAACALPEAPLVLGPCRELARETGAGPSTSLLVIQRLHRRVAEGKVTVAQAQAVAALFDAAEDYGLPPADAVAAELAPVLRRHVQAQVVLAAYDEYARRGDFTRIIGGLEAAARIGLGASGPGGGSVLIAKGAAVIRDPKQYERMGTGIRELDDALEGGMPRRCLGVALGDTNDGKSMWLVQIVCQAMRVGLPVALVTTETPRDEMIARIWANLTGLPTRGIIQSEAIRAQAEAKLATMTLGPGIVDEMPAHATTVKDVRDWAKGAKDLLGADAAVVVIDYADQLHDSRVRPGDMYNMFRLIYTDLLHDVAKADNRWVWTAAAVSRPDKDKIAGKGPPRVHGMGRVSESTHKVKIPDLVVTLNVSDDDTEQRYHIAKHRYGPRKLTIGPLPTDYAHGRITAFAGAEF